MKVLIIDDEPLALSELRFLLDKQSNVDQVVEADGVTAAKQQLAKEAPDMMFLDIRLEDGNGMAFAKQLKERPDCPYIVFATAYDQYALDAFEAQAVDYVMKPFEQGQIDEAVNRVQKLLDRSARTPGGRQVSQQNANPRLSLSSDDRTFVVQKTAIYYIEAVKGKTKVVTDREIISSQALKKLYAQLDPGQFLQVHRSYIVNLNQVREVQPSFNQTYVLTLENGAKVPVSRSYVAAVKLALGINQ